jgi:hypothetical protein
MDWLSILVTALGCFVFYHLGAGHFDNEINRALHMLGLRKESKKNGK